MNNKIEVTLQDILDISRTKNLPAKLVNFIKEKHDKVSLEDIPDFTKSDRIELSKLLEKKSKDRSEMEEDRVMELQFLFAADYFRDKVVDDDIDGEEEKQTIRAIALLIRALYRKK